MTLEAPRLRPKLRGDGQTVMFVAIDGKIAALIGVADPIKESTPEAIEALHREGIRIVMLTGDSKTTADAVARTLGIDEVIAEVLPDQKVEVVKRLQAEGRVRGDGGRRHQRRAGPGAGAGRHRDGHRHRRGDGKRRRDAGQRATCAASCAPGGSVV